MHYRTDAAVEECVTVRNWHTHGQTERLYYATRLKQGLTPVKSGDPAGIYVIDRVSTEIKMSACGPRVPQNALFSPILPIRLVDTTTTPCGWP